MSEDRTLRRVSAGRKNRERLRGIVEEKRIRSFLRKPEWARAAAFNPPKSKFPQTASVWETGWTEATEPRRRGAIPRSSHLSTIEQVNLHAFVPPGRRARLDPPNSTSTPAPRTPLAAAGTSSERDRPPPLPRFPPRPPLLVASPSARHCSSFPPPGAVRPSRVK